MKILLLLTSLLFGSISIAGVSEGFDALEKGDYETAIFNFKKTLDKAEDGGSAYIHRLLGFSYYSAPDKIDTDYSLSFKHLSLSLGKEFDARVHTLIGSMYYFGQGIDRDYMQAKKHFELANKYQDSESSVWLLGKMYLHGYGVEQDYDKAREYFGKGDILNSANSQFELAHLYEYGKGVPKSIPRALEFYEKAASQGDGDAQYKINVHTGKISKEDRDQNFEKALDYSYGYTQEIDFDKAIELYELAAKNGSYTSVYNIGFLIEYISNTKQHQKAGEYYKKSAEMGNVYAQTTLAIKYRLGSGVQADKEQSFYWEREAALQGNIESILATAENYYDGYGVGKNYDQAAKWYQKAVDLGDKESIHKLAQMHERGEGFRTDTDKAVELYERAAKLDYGESQNQLSDYYFRGKYVDQDYQKSFDLALKASEQGVADAYNKLGVFYHTGKNVVEVDMEKAFEYFNQAVELGNKKAYVNLGRLYEHGKGVKQNKTKAFNYFKKGAEKGNTDSQYELGRLYDYGIAVQKDVKEAIKWYELANEEEHKKSQIALGNVYYYGDDDAEIPRNYKKAAQFYLSAARNDKDKDRPIAFQTTSSGSGFFVTPTHIITNDHVTKSCDEILIKNKNYESKVELLDADSTTDLSILVTGKSNDNFLKFRGRSPLRTGETSIALGYPFASKLGSELKVTTGNIAALTGFNNNIAELQLTSPVQPGNSGGPLLDNNGNVIGVIVSRLEKSSEITGDRPAQNVNFAIKSSMAKIFMDLNTVSYYINDGAQHANYSIEEIVSKRKGAVVKVICKEEI